MYFHYTNIDAFFNIALSGKVWFSSLAFMNDEMEGFDLHEVLSEILCLKHGEEETKKALKLIDTTIETCLRFQLSFSASTLKDDISQWRAYTNLGQGICIEFIDGFISEDTAYQYKCLYGFEEKRRAIISDKNLKANDITIEHILSSQEGMNSYINSIITTLVRFKNASFSPEKEIRWVITSSGLTSPNSGLKFRPHRLGLTSYREVGVDLSKVKSITIGPQMSEQNLKTIEDFAIHNNCAGYITKTKVTLR